VELLRILKEVLTNARRHSGARNVEVRLRTESETLGAEVTDDGRGFDPMVAWGSWGCESGWRGWVGRSSSGAALARVPRLR
jgi:signal transduction histidine kinase